MEGGCILAPPSCRTSPQLSLGAPPMDTLRLSVLTPAAAACPSKRSCRVLLRAPSVFPSFPLLQIGLPQISLQHLSFSLVFVLVYGIYGNFYKKSLKVPPEFLGYSADLSRVLPI